MLQLQFFYCYPNTGNLSMTQTQPQRPLLRIGSIAFLAGVIIAIVSTAIHSSKEDPASI